VRGVLKIGLRAPGFTRLGTIALAVTALFYWGAFAWFVPLVLEGGQWSDPSARLMLLGLGAFGIYLGSNAVARIRALGVEPRVEFGLEAVALPVGTAQRRMETVAYGEVDSFHVAGRPPIRRVVVGARGRAFVLMEAAFLDEEAFPRFVMELRHRIRDLPGGEARLALIDHNVQFTRKALSKPIRGTIGILILCCLGFLAQLGVGLEDETALVRLGANAPSLVADGQYYRLITANFLHGSWLHLYMNAAALWSVGALVERLIGGTRFLIVYLLSAIGGAAASTLVGQAALSVGASTAIFGVLGALFVVNLRYRGQLPVGFQQSARWWGFILGLNAALPLVVPQIDVAAHAGGFVVGAGVSALFVLGKDATALLVRPTGQLTRVLALSLGLGCTLAGIYGARRAVVPVPEDELRVLRDSIRHFDDDPLQLNRMAWTWATRPGATELDLELALEAARRAVDQLPREPAVVDTLATVHHMRGEAEEAVRLETSAVELVDALELPAAVKGPYAAQLRSQLARFQSARLAAGHRVEGVELELSDEGAPRVVTLRLEQPLPEGARIDALATRGTLLIGHVRLDLGPRGAGAITVSEPDGPAEQWVKGVVLTPSALGPAPALVDDAPPDPKAPPGATPPARRPLAPDEVRMSAIAQDHEVARLPEPK
jgi:rhomboid protease GluP